MLGRSRLTCMEEQVVLEVGVLAEAAVADVTFERPRTAVDVHVRLEIPRRRERLGAQRTLVWFILKIPNGHCYFSQFQAQSNSLKTVSVPLNRLCLSLLVIRNTRLWFQTRLQARISQSGAKLKKQSVTNKNPYYVMIER